MATIIIQDEGIKADIPDGSQVIDACEALGIVFGCTQGNCGTCKTIVLEGIENLSEKNDKEIAMNLEGNERLMCQCKIDHGTIKLRQE